MERNGHEDRGSGGDGNREILVGRVLLGNGEQPAAADLWRRLVARLIDSLILVVILAILDILTEGTLRATLGDIRTIFSGEVVFHSDDLFGGLNNFFVFLVVIFVYLLALFYDMLLVTCRGYTPGKRIICIRIVSVEDGSKPRFWKACGRAIVLHSPCWRLRCTRVVCL